MLSNFINFINELGPAISIVICGVMALIFDRREKKNKKIRELEQQKLALETEAQKKAAELERQKLIERIELLDENQTAIINPITEMKDGLEKVIRIALDDRGTIEALVKNVEKDYRNITDINKKLFDMLERIDTQNEDLRRISMNLHNYSIYTQALANVVIILAEALRDNNINGNVSQAISSFRDAERDMFAFFSEENLVLPKKEKK